MDRLREASRRGSLSGGAQTSTVRRPRSSGVFKDPADDDEVMEDLHSVRLRERPRKDGATHSVARHKRTRHASRELQPRAEDVEDADVGEVGPSEEDDLPISPNLLPRKPTKLRFHGKVASDEVIAVEIPAVPRKARTAISKRPHDGNHGDGPRHQVFALAPVSSTAVAPSHSVLGPSLKPIKRMKQNSSKIKVLKNTKVLSAPVTISQQEVEVAEALFDLARMVSNFGSPLGIDEKIEVNTENSDLKGTARLSSPEGTPVRCQDSVSTPATSHSAVSSPVRGPIPVTSSHLSSTEGSTKKIFSLKMKTDDRALSQSKDDTNGLVSGLKSVVDSCTGQSIGSSTPVEVASHARAGQGSHEKAALSSSLLAMPSQSSVVADSNALVTEVKSSSSPKIPTDNVMGSDYLLKCDASLLTASSEQIQQCGIGHINTCNPSALAKDKTLKTSHPCKYEFDLMASPNVSASGVSEKTSNSVDSGLGSRKPIQDQVNDSLLSTQNRATEVAMDTSMVKEEKTSTGNEQEARMSTKPKEEHVLLSMMKESEKEKQFVEVPKQEASDFLQSKTDSIPQHPTTGSGWPVGLAPPMGYYPAAAAAAAAAAAVAAAWPATGSVIRPVSMEEKGHPGLLVPPFTFPGARPLCKRCATHVYIAHFIDTQHQMQRHPIWAAYGNNASGSLYPMKSFNPSLPPNALFGGGLSGLTGLTVNNSPTSKGLNSEPGPQHEKGSASTVKEKLTSQNIDGSVKKGASQSLQPDIKDHSTSLQGGLGMFGYSLAAPSHASLGTGRNDSPNTGIPGGSTTAITSYPEPARASTGASTTDSLNTAAAQVQYLQAIIQQAGFPFSFPPGHMMPPSQGHPTQQQAANFFGNPFYNPPFVHSQQGHATCKVASKPGSLPGQSTNMHQDLRVSQSLSQCQQQQQQQFSSASSSHSHQKAASQHVQHFGDVEMNMGGETVSSAESKFPGYQKSMHGHEINNMHTSNVTSSSSSLNSVGLSVLPGQVALAAKQVTNMKLPPQSGPVHQQLPNTTAYHYPSGSKGFDMQATQALSGGQMGIVNKNMVGPGPLGLASVAAVMAPQGHTVLQTMADTQLSHVPPYQEGYNKHTPGLNLDGGKVSSGVGIAEDERLAVKQGGPVKVDKESEGSGQGSSGYKSGLSSISAQPGISGTSFSFMSSAVGIPGSKQVPPVSVGAVPSMGVGRASPNITVSASEPTMLSKTSSPSLLFHVPNVSNNQGLRQGQAAAHYSSQAKPASRMQAVTPGVSAATSPLLPGSYPGIPASKQQSYPSKHHQAAASSIQSRFPPTSGSPGASISPSTSNSKVSGSTAVKNVPAVKGSFNSLQKPGSATIAKKAEGVLTHLPGQVIGPSSISVNMGQSHSQSHQSHNQHMQQFMRQQQQQWQQQQKQVHQEHLQQVPQSMHHQFQVTGMPPTVAMQYHQALGTNQTAQIGMHKQSASPQQAKQRPYLEQHLYQPQQQQSQSTDSQQSARIGTQPQQLHHAQQNAVTSTNRSAQQLTEMQANKQQSNSCHQQPLSLASFGAFASSAPHTPSFSVGSGGSGGRPASSDGNLKQVSSPKASISMKPPGGISVSVAGPNLQRSSTSSMGVSHFHGMGAKVMETKLPPQSSGNISYLPYLQSATPLGVGAAAGKNLGALVVHTQNSGASMISMRDGLGGAGQENNASNMYENDRPSSASKAPLMSGHSASATPVRSPVSQPMASCIAPMPVHGPAQSSQTCTVTSATMTADSISTTG